MQELKAYAPTYYGSTTICKSGAKHEFDEPRVPIVVRPADGVRVVLGTHDYFGNDAPDIQIERRPNGWAIFLHPVGGGDPCGYVVFIDDGRSFVIPERYLGTTPSIKVLSWDETIAQVDNLNTHE